MLLDFTPAAQVKGSLFETPEDPSSTARMKALDAINRKFGRGRWFTPYDVHMRIGIHTGTVAAGVVGKKRFSYDLWGDVVRGLAKACAGMASG